MASRNNDADYGIIVYRYHPKENIYDSRYHRMASRNNDADYDLKTLMNKDADYDHHEPTPINHDADCGQSPH